ncbi:rap guanine nucleotide exchange factor 4, partial [Aphis craccivora]
PSDRSAKDVEAITSRLRRVDTLNRLPNNVLQQLAFVGYYEDLERGVMPDILTCERMKPTVLFRVKWFCLLAMLGLKKKYITCR